MVRQLSHAFFFLLIVWGVTACAVVRPGFQQDRFPLYDVRDVTVFANQPGSAGLIAGVDRRVSDAIAATRRLEMVPRVVLSVRLERVRKAMGVESDRHEAEFSVDAVSVDNGAILASGDFKAITYSDAVEMRDEILAEAIAARIRAAFGLMTPPVTMSGMRRPPPPEYDQPPLEPVQFDPPPAPLTLPDTPVMQPDAGGPAPAFPPAPKPAPAKARDVPARETHKAGSDLETGAQGRISLKPAADAAPATSCGEGTAAPCPAAPAQP